MKATKKSHKIKLNKLDESKNQYSYYFQSLNVNRQNKWEGRLNISDTIFKINDIPGKPQ